MFIFNHNFRAQRCIISDIKIFIFVLNILLVFSNNKNKLCGKFPLKASYSAWNLWLLKHLQKTEFVLYKIQIFWGWSFMRFYITVSKLDMFQVLAVINSTLLKQLYFEKRFLILLEGIFIFLTPILWAQCG